MKIDKKYSGMWVAIKSEKVIASDKTLVKLSKKTNKMHGSENFRYTLLPKGLFVGTL